MIEELRNLLNNAYSPYFNYPVACILVCKDGKRFFGVNVETASPSSGICAERNAIYSAIASGYKKDDFKELHIMNKTDKYSYPCFICRQALVEFCSSCDIFVYKFDGTFNKVNALELCPFSFDGDNLK